MIGKVKAITKKRSVEVNDYGTDVASWIEMGEIYGYFDYATVSKNQIAQKFVEDSTHIFITEQIVPLEQGDRLIISNETYEVNYVDNPLNMGYHLEIELKPVLDRENTYEHIFYIGINNNPIVTEDIVSDFEQMTMRTKALTKEFSSDDGILHIVYPKVLGKSSIRLNNSLIVDWNIEELIINDVVVLHYSKEITQNEKNKIEIY